MYFLYLYKIFYIYIFIFIFIYIFLGQYNRINVYPLHLSYLLIYHMQKLLHVVSQNIHKGLHFFPFKSCEWNINVISIHTVTEKQHEGQHEGKKRQKVGFPKKPLKKDRNKISTENPCRCIFLHMQCWWVSWTGQKCAKFVYMYFIPKASHSWPSAFCGIAFSPLENLADWRFHIMQTTWGFWFAIHWSQAKVTV